MGRSTLMVARLRTHFNRLSMVLPVRLGAGVAGVILVITGALAAIGYVAGPPIVRRIYHGEPLGPLGEIRIVSGRNQVPLEVYFDWLYLALNWIVGVGIAWALAALVSGFLLQRREEGRGLPERETTVAIVLVAAVGLVALATVVLQRFPNSADEYAYLFQAETLAQGRLWNEPTPLPEHFWFIHIAQQDGKWLSRFPPGWPAMLAVFVWAGIPTWLLNPLLGLGTLVVVVLLFRELNMRHATPIAVAAMASSPFFLFNGASYFCHMSCLACIVVAAWLAARYRKNALLWEAAGVGLALGVAFTIRYFTAVLVGIPLLVYLAAGHPRRILRTSLAVTAGAALPLALMLAYQALITDSPWLLVTQWIDPTEGLGFIKGHTPARAVEAMFLHLGRLVIWASPALLVLLVSIACSRKCQPWVWMACATFVTCLLGYTLYYNLGGNQYGPRFYFEGWALATLGVVVWAFREPAPAAQRLPRFVVIFGLLAGAFVFPMLAYREHRVVAERMDLQRRVEQAGLNKAVVIVSDGTGVIRAMPPYDLTRNGTSLDDEVLYVLDLGADTPKQLHARFPDRDIYRYRRQHDQVNGKLEWVP